MIELINKVLKYIGAKNEDYQERMGKLMGGPSREGYGNIKEMA